MTKMSRLGTRSPLSRMLRLLGVVILSTCPLSAQTGAGAVQGTVRDTSGAVVPGAGIKLRNVA
ncbi:MAG: hypothetical protein ACE15B_00495, partial [Bryobacteraceae bacterium]